MTAIKISPIEKLRRIWTPGREVEEIVAQLEPQTELDSMIRDLLHRVVQQHGPFTVNFGNEVEPVFNEGTLRWEVIHGPGPDHLRSRQASIWIENE